MKNNKVYSHMLHACLYSLLAFIASCKEAQKSTIVWEETETPAAQQEEELSPAAKAAKEAPSSKSDSEKSTDEKTVSETSVQAETASETKDAAIVVERKAWGLPTPNEYLDAKEKELAEKKQNEAKHDLTLKIQASDTLKQIRPLSQDEEKAIEDLFVSSAVSPSLEEKKEAPNEPSAVKIESEAVKSSVKSDLTADVSNKAALAVTRDLSKECSAAGFITPSSCMCKAESSPTPGVSDPMIGSDTQASSGPENYSADQAIERAALTMKPSQIVRIKMEKLTEMNSKIVQCSSDLGKLKDSFDNKVKLSKSEIEQACSIKTEAQIKETLGQVEKRYQKIVGDIETDLKVYSYPSAIVNGRCVATMNTGEKNVFGLVNTCLNVVHKLVGNDGRIVGLVDATSTKGSEQGIVSLSCKAGTAHMRFVPEKCSEYKSK
jgi:hypothetical protein